MRAALAEHFLDQGSCGMNISPEHRVLEHQERLVDASGLLGVKLDRLTQFVPAQNTVAQTALNQARRAAAALPEVAHDTALAMNMGTAWNHRQKARKHDPNKSRVVLADITNCRVDRKKGMDGTCGHHCSRRDTARTSWERLCESPERRLTDSCKKSE